MNKFTLPKSEQTRIWKEARDGAGPRYNKDFNVQLSIQELFEGIGRTDEFFNEIADLKKESSESFKFIKFQKISAYKEAAVRENLSTIKTLGTEFLKEMNVLSKSHSQELDLTAISQKAEILSEYFYPIDKFVWEKERQEEEEQKKKATEEKKEYIGHIQSEYLRKLKDLQYSIDNFHRAVRKIHSFSKSSKAQLANEPFLLILGNAGMGKTHLVCDITKNRLETNLPPTIIVLGEKLIKVNNPLESIFRACSIQDNTNHILDYLNKTGKRRKKRSLIIVDAINEADRRGWKESVDSLRDKIRKYPWIGLVMTCRIPFENLSLPKDFKIITEYHEGFAENELEAMKKFFRFYKLPLPEIPLLISEFSSPLFLSCFCKSAKDIKGGKAKIARTVRDLALGQIGMTKILEDFYRNKETQLIEKYNSKFKYLIGQDWLWNKLIKMSAEQMVITEKYYLEQGEIIDILKRISNNKYSDQSYLSVLNILIEEGVFVRDAAWDDKNKRYFDVIKFPFHKFSDHIIARYLLQANFFNPKKVKQSFAAKNALGKLFENRNAVLSNIDIIEALMIEFPERVKSNKSMENKDLIDFLQNDIKQLPEIRSAFINSLYWRKPDNFLNNSGKIKQSIIDYINKEVFRYEESYREFMDFFISAATKPSHPFNADRLSEYLSKFPIAQRDLFWSEYLRKQDETGSIHKLISWVENQDISNISPEQAYCVITVLGWTLTTNVHSLRNRATRCIYIVGIIEPKQCYQATEILIETNEPYIIERVLASCYGVAMALHFNNDKSFLNNNLYPFAKQIYSLFFKKKALYGTTNIFIRDYARGIIEIAIFHKEDLLSATQIKRARPPYKDGGIRQWGRSTDKNKGEYRDGNAPLGMDFENYTLGHLAPDRRNYDYEHKDFIKIKENVLWRIYQLGYSLEKFGDIDKNIVQNSRLNRGSNYVGKIDRYGKKYSWIAYYELLGIKMDKREVKEWLISENGRKEECDIDPSFPQISYEQKPLIFSDLLSGPHEEMEWLTQKKSPDISSYLELKEIDGVKGPWIMINGTIGEKNTKKGKRITTFITGLLIDQKYQGKLKDFLARTKCPGNDSIPSLPDVYKLFAGELGWHEDNSKEEPQYLKINRGQKKIKIAQKKQPRYYDRIFFDLGLTKKRLAYPKYRIEQIIEKIPAQPLARYFHTKDYSYGIDDNDIGIYILGKKYIKTQKLHRDANSLNLSNKKNEIVSISFIQGDQFGSHTNLLYVRKDLLENIIKKCRKKLFIVAWGERQIWSENGFIRNKDLDPIYQSYKNVYKELIEYGQ